MKNQSGFTLISVLIALVLISVGLMSVSRAGGEVLKAHAVAGSRTTAVAIARGHMELLRSQPPGTLESEASVYVNESGAPDPAGLYTRSVVVEEMRHNLIWIQVVVEFPRSNRPVELETFAFVGNIGN